MQPIVSGWHAACYRRIGCSTPAKAQSPSAKKAAKKAPVKASRKAVKKVAAKRQQRAAATPPKTADTTAAE